MTESVEWPAVDRPRRAAVSSFGISGTNAHVIVEQAPFAVPAVAEPRRTDVVVPVVLHARKADGLARQAEKLRSHLLSRPDLEPLDVGYSTVSSRAVLEHQAVVVGRDREDLIAALGAVVEPVAPGSVAFLFTGQGSQRLGMGRDLHKRFPVFAEAFDAAAAATGLPVSDVAWGDDGDLLGQTVNTQAVVFAFEVALFRLLRSFGVRPDYLAGHSIGEIAAAHAAGVLSLADAGRLVGARGRLMQALPSGGVMVAVAAPESAVLPLLVDGVDIAAVNGPASVVLSGVEDAVQAVVNTLGVKATRLNTSHAFHSHLMEPMLDEFT
ncbi:acyltransferase domain-containing protein, partial [Micromonospora sp. NPDC006766]|uniref:acyltransferase domain-containing protein n=1 Tax=Micromonospora sp. NPDC006766 TaxID=3154778 RepID=UPI0033C3F73C